MASSSTVNAEVGQVGTKDPNRTAGCAEFLRRIWPSTWEEAIEASAIAWEISLLRKLGVFALMDSLYEQYQTGTLNGTVHPDTTPFFDALEHWNWRTESPDNPLSTPVIDAFTQAITAPLLAFAHATVRYATSMPLSARSGCCGPSERDLADLYLVGEGLRLAIEANVKTVLVNQRFALLELADHCKGALKPDRLASVGIPSVDVALATMTGSPVATWPYIQIIEGGVDLLNSLSVCPPGSAEVRAAVALREGARGLGLLPPVQESPVLAQPTALASPTRQVLGYQLVPARSWYHN